MRFEGWRPMGGLAALLVALAVLAVTVVTGALDPTAPTGASRRVDSFELRSEF
jgi:hypothetical protein